MSMKRPFARHEARRLTVPASQMTTPELLASLPTPQTVFELVLYLDRGAGTTSLRHGLYSTRAKAVAAALANGVAGILGHDIHERTVL